MGAQSNAAPVIIKRKKVISGGGHHGGAWKVAYADFVTAMMAFFMLMWLLNATTEKQRKGLADYFSPTIPINRVSGGGSGAFGGTSVFSEETLTQSGTGANQVAPAIARQSLGLSGLDPNGADHDDSKTFEEVESKLMGRGGESLVAKEALKHIVTRVTDEGLIIELFAIEGSPLFKANSDTPTNIMRDLTRIVSQAAVDVENGIAVTGHIRAHPVVLAESPVWELSSKRAAVTRRLLENSGTNPQRIQRVTGHADRKTVHENPMAVRNNRVEITLLRTPPDK